MISGWSAQALSVQARYVRVEVFGSATVPAAQARELDIFWLRCDRFDFAVTCPNQRQRQILEPYERGHRGYQNLGIRAEARS